MVSTIDTIALAGDEEIDIRGWIRTFADSGKPIYVGIYTSFRHEQRGYVSVGFRSPGELHRHSSCWQRRRARPRSDVAKRAPAPGPLPELGRQRARRPDRAQLLYFQERIFVYVADGELKTDHSFYLAGQRFLTLHYEIERLGGEPPCQR